MRRRAVAAEAYVTLFAIRVVLRVAPGALVAWSLRLSETPPSTDRERLEEAEEIAAVVHAVARRHLIPMLCLPCALATQVMLLRRGTRAQLVIGVRRAGNGITGHAWIEVDGGVIPRSHQIVSAKFARAERILTRLYRSSKGHVWQHLPTSPTGGADHRE